MVRDRTARRDGDDHLGRATNAGRGDASPPAQLVAPRANTLIVLRLRSRVVSPSRLRLGRRWLVGGLIAVGIVVIAAIFVRSVVLRDRARAVPADEALAIFRAEATTTTTTAPTPTTATVTATPAATTSSPETSVEVPPTAPPPAEPGIYRYRTTGSEDVDALGGATHDYPAETTITVIASGCGAHLRWDALRERRDEWALCSTPDGIALQPDGVQYHEFFGQPDEEAVACDSPVLVVPAASTGPPAVQHQSCTLANDPWLPSWEVLERSTRSIDGTDIGVQHVRMTIDDDDEYWEHTVVDWYLTDSGLPLEVRSTKESRSPSPIGGVVYHEHYDIELISIVPLQ